MGRLVIGGLTQQREVQVDCRPRERRLRRTEKALARRSLHDFDLLLAVRCTGPNAQVRDDNKQPVVVLICHLDNAIERS